MAEQAQTRSAGSLDGRIAVVTGAARGIGREAAVALAARGASFAVTAGDSAHFTA